MALWPGNRRGGWLPASCCCPGTACSSGARKECASEYQTAFEASAGLGKDDRAQPQLCTAQPNPNPAVESDVLLLPELRRLQAVPTNPRLSHCCATPRSPTRCPAALGSHVSAPWGQAGSAGLPCLSCSWCCRQQEEDGPRGYTSRWPLLPTPTPPLLLPAPRRRARAGTLPVPAGNPIQHRGRRPNKDFYVRQRKKGEKKKEVFEQNSPEPVLGSAPAAGGFPVP